MNEPITTSQPRPGAERAAAPTGVAASGSLTGSVVSGRYRLDRPIGRGAFAEVYSAWDMALNRWTAAKVYSAGVAAGVSGAEVRLQATCQHPNLMPLHDAGTDSQLGVAYIVMPLYPGADLAATIARVGPLPFRRSIQCVDQICSALDYLWQQRQAIHGDIKPSNIWITGSGAALLMDFNLQALLVSGSYARLGSPGYTAPESLHGHIDARSDVFSLGCVLYACLAGSAPFADDAAVLEGRYAPLRSHRSDVRPELEEVVRTALHPDPAQRFQSVRELQGALRRRVPLERPAWAPRAAGGVARILGGGALLAAEGAWGIAGGLWQIARRWLHRLCRRPGPALLEAAVALWLTAFGLRWGQAYLTRFRPEVCVAAAVGMLALIGAARRGARRERGRRDK